VFFHRFCRARCTFLIAMALAACARDVPPVTNGVPSVGAEQGDAVNDTMRSVLVDDLGRPLRLDSVNASRVVSLTPAITELIVALGAAPQLVARTSWDVTPPEVRALPDIGNGLRPNVEALLAERPTLVLLYASPDNQPAVDALDRAGVQVIALRTVTMADFERATHIVGTALRKRDSAAALLHAMRNTLDRVQDAVRDQPRRTVVWPLWESPVMVAGNGGFEADLMRVAGAHNVYEDRVESVVTVSIEDIARRDPDLVLAVPQRGARMRASVPWRTVRAIQAERIIAIDTMLIGRPGVHMAEAAVALARALHPTVADRLP
jgi:ABC-type Fe3+-hydroxamate transport system substrate-binding protein